MHIGRGEALAQYRWVRLCRNNVAARVLPLNGPHWRPIVQGDKTRPQLCGETTKLASPHIVAANREFVGRYS